MMPAVRSRSQRERSAEECLRDTPQEKDAIRVNSPGPHLTSAFGARVHRQQPCRRSYSGEPIPVILNVPAGAVFGLLTAALYTASALLLNFGPYMLLMPE